MATIQNTATEEKLLDVLQYIARERNISFEMLLEALEAALLTAYKRHFGSEVERDRHRRPADAEPIASFTAAPSSRRSRIPKLEISMKEAGAPYQIGDYYDQEVDAERLRPHRRADRQASDRAAHPRGRARHGLQQIRSQTQRHRHRHGAALRAAQHVHHARGARRSRHVSRRTSAGRVVPHQRFHPRLRARRAEDHRRGRRSFYRARPRDSCSVFSSARFRRSPTAWSRSWRSRAIPGAVRRSR